MAGGVSLRASCFMAVVCDHTTHLRTGALTFRFSVDGEELTGSRSESSEAGPSTFTCSSAWEAGRLCSGWRGGQEGAPFQPGNAGISTRRCGGAGSGLLSTGVAGVGHRNLRLCV